MVHEGVDDLLAREICLVENLIRRDPHFMDQADAVAELHAAGAPLQAIADRTGRTIGWVARLNRLTALTPAWRERARSIEEPFSHWTAAHYEAVAYLGPEAQDAFYETWSQSLHYHVPSVRDLERRIGELFMDVARAPEDPKDETLLPAAGACSSCPLRSSQHPALPFEGFASSKPAKGREPDRCLEPTCWRRKKEALAERFQAANPGAVLISRGHRPGTFSPHQVTQARKSTPGAVRALELDGEHAGRIGYVVVDDRRTTTQQSTAVPATAVRPQGPIPLAVREIV